MSRALRLAVGAALVLALSACGRNMFDQAKVEPFEASPFFADGAGMRPLIPGTVSREVGRLDPAYLTGEDGRGGYLVELPVALTLELLERGRQRFDVYCAPCHDYDGRGTGAVVRRGFPQPASLVDEPRLLESPVGYFYSVITNGKGSMLPYASRVQVEDRWAIAAYVRALQLSQNADPSDVPTGAQVVRPTVAEAGR